MPTIKDARNWYSQNDPVHGYDHIYRVYMLALRLAESEGADVEIVKAAVLLHDINEFHETELGRKVKDTWIDKMTGRAEGYKGAYVKPDSDELIAEYRNGYNEISLTPKSGISEIEILKTIKKEEIRRLGLSKEIETKACEEIDTIADIDKLRTQSEAIIKRIKEGTDKKVIVISESDLENHLNHGWIYVGVTPSGKCIIKRI